MRLGLSSLSPVALALLLFSACGDEEASDTPASTEPPTLTLVSVSTASGAFEPPRVPCNGELVVRAEPSATWALRPPGQCAASLRCGHVFIRASSSELTASARTAGRTALLTLSPPEAWAGAVVFEAELARDTGEPYRNPDGSTVRSSLTLELLPAEGCPINGEGGAGGSGGSQEGGSAGVDSGGGAPPDAGAGGTSTFGGEGGAAGGGGVPDAGGGAGGTLEGGGSSLGGESDGGAGPAGAGGALSDGGSAN